MFVYSPNKQSDAAEPARRVDLRAHNTGVLLRLLWAAADGQSRADLSRSSGLSRATVSAIVGKLLESGLVLEGSQRASSGGRPGTVLRFNNLARTIVGIELGASHIAGVRTDLHGDVLQSLWAEHDVQRDPTGALDVVSKFVSDLRSAAEAPLLGVGMAVPSPIRSDQPGRLSVALLPKWRDIDLREEMVRRTGLPVRIDNDANLGALAEHWWGAGRGVSDFAYVKVATGVGAGIIMNGDIYRGAGGVAGEIGHTAIDPSGPRCRCGLDGCLEALVGTQYLLERAEEYASACAERPVWATPFVTLPALVAAADRGDQGAIELVRSTGHWLGIAIANLLNLFNPRRIVLGGRLTSAGELLLQPLRTALEQRTLWTSVESAQVVVSTLSSNSVPLGSATLVLQNALSEPSSLLRTAHGAPSMLV